MDGQIYVQSRFYIGMGGKMKAQTWKGGIIKGPVIIYTPVFLHR